MFINAIAALAYAFLGITAFSRGFTPPSLGLAIYNLLAVWLFLNRRTAERTGTWWEQMLALAGTFLPIVVLSPGRTKWPLAGTAVETLALAGMVWSLASLGKALGIGPADRALVASGPYRRVRHPLYSFELLFGVGYCLAYPSWRNVVAWVALVAIQVTRALREERVIDGYNSYRACVRWRFVPGVV